MLHEFIMRQVSEVEILILDVLKACSTCKQKYSLGTNIQNERKTKSGTCYLSLSDWQAFEYRD